MSSCRVRSSSNIDIASAFNKATSGRIHFNAAMVEVRMQNMSWKTKMEALPWDKTKYREPSIDWFDYWNVPFWFTTYAKEKFDGKRIMVNNKEERVVRPFDNRKLAQDLGSMAIHFDSTTYPYDTVCMCGVYDVSDLQLATIGPLDEHVAWAPRHFEHLGWPSVLSSNKRLNNNTLNTIYKPAAEAVTYVIPKLRAMPTVQGMSFGNTFEIPCRMLLYNHAVKVATDTKQTHIVTVDYPDPPPGWLDAFLYDIAPGLVNLGGQALSGNWAEAARSGLNLVPKVIGMFTKKKEKDQSSSEDDQLAQGEMDPVD
ncbi:Hypothetical predicted protein [Olea europaea subsp. europaea]|uniref:Uncharacterized protein n=1 Tax=Olea europaea subsp. europaea TaxID=158383 RepID=A0A8S0THC1_OLEEU|nr:Hypothetical predicted protein [Olea europaea subsp. europaea]